MSNSASTSAGTGGFTSIALAGAALAAWCRWQLWQSPFWAAIHAIFGWFYVTWLCMGCGGGLPSGFWGP